jgi:hypothetical protein
LVFGNKTQLGLAVTNNPKVYLNDRFYDKVRGFKYFGKRDCETNLGGDLLIRNFTHIRFPLIDSVNLFGRICKN